MSRPYRRYTAPLIRRCIARVANSESTRAVAESEGAGVWSVQKWCAKAEVLDTRLQYDDATRDRCLQRIRDGEAVRAVSRAEGVPTSTISRWCQSAGVQSRYRFAAGGPLAQEAA